MVRSQRWVLFFAGIGFLGAAVVWQTSFSGAQVPEGKGKAAVGPLPIRQIVLFNSGVGYFQREGEVVGNSRIELTFPAADINDLLKSLVLQDLGGGLISTVNYDSHDPVEKILRSFALDLNNNPSFGQILNQARGEKIDLTLLPKKDGQAVHLAGTIVGMESQRQAAGRNGFVEVEMLNLNGSKGLQSIPLAQAAGVKFQNAVLDNEFQRALKVLAASHDTQKKLVSLGFNGAGKRAVRVGYVVERPIWKTTYRLRLEPNGKLFLQGWALVENTSDDDWNDVRMVLVCGKPISYQMNLYEPLYIPRPFVEPDHFASLRPPVYGGALDADGNKAGANVPNQQILGGQFGQFGQVGQLGQGQFGMMGAGAPPVPASQGGPADIRSGGQLGQFGQNIFAPFTGQQGQFGQLGQFGMFGGQPGNFQGVGGSFNGASFNGAFGGNRFQQNIFSPNMNTDGINNRLTYEELVQRRLQRAKENAEAKKSGSAIAGMNFKEGIQSVATAEEVGDYFQYVLDQKISLPRQKSAMVPILDQTIEGAKVSIYNEDIHAKYPLLGLRLKNTSGKPLTQGPITVYDSSNYAGDTRILDVQPGEERLLSYALDQGTEVKTIVKKTPSTAMRFRIDEPRLAARYIMRETKTYTIKNRSVHDRAVIVEHPIRTDWKLVGAEPTEKTRDVYRFTVAVPAGKTVSLDVAEEQPRVDELAFDTKGPRYAALLGIGVKVLTHAYEDKLIEVKFQNDILRVVKIARESKTYVVQNLSAQDRDFTVDHVVRAGWTLIDKQGAAQKTGPDVFQFKLTVPKGKTQSHELIEEQTQLFPTLVRQDGTPNYPIGPGLVFRIEPHRYVDRLVGLKIQKGILLITKKLRTSHTYVVQNNTDEDRDFIIDHAIPPERVLFGEDGAPEKAGPAIYRFKLAVPKGKAATRDLKEETLHKEKGQALKDVSETAVREYFDHPVPSAEVKAALQQVLRLAARANETAKQLADSDKQLEDLTKDQARLRSNLQIVPQSSEHYKKFLEKFVAQEGAIETVQRQARLLQGSLQKQQREQQEFVGGLNAE